MTSASRKARGFTLLELIIVIAILAILAVAVVLVINPAEMLRRARDSQRFSDLAAVKSAIGLYLSDIANPNLASGAGNCGTHGYISTNVADASDVVCGFSGANLLGSVSGNPDGSGWIPVNLTAISSGSPLSNYPIDPLNDLNGTPTAGDDIAFTGADEDYIYYYVCNATKLQFELGANLESVLYGTTEDRDAVDGGDNNDAYEVGTSLTLCQVV